MPCPTSRSSNGAARRSPYLFRIAANLIADRWKQVSREHLDSVDPASDDLDRPQWPDIERRVILFRLVDDLPADRRSVIIKRFVEGKSIREFALEFGKSEGAIKQLQYRALETLRDQAGGRHE
jgi:RNA polymerase sigma-70 factor (ECF subfamily)